MSQAESQDKNPDVVPKAKRRQFTAAYKRQILQEVDACTQPGEKGALLRREGLSASHIAAWRRQQGQDQRQRAREMNHAEDAAAEAPDAPDTHRSGSNWIWLTLLAGTVALPIYCCMSVVFLVLTGIIAEPETVIEQILRALFGG